VKYVQSKPPQIPSKLPVVRMGTSVELHTTVELGGEFQMSTRLAEALLRKLGVPTFSMGIYQYFSIHTLEQAMFAITELGAPGFAAPGSKRKHVTLPHQRHKKTKGVYHKEVTDIREWYEETGRKLKPEVGLLRRMELAARARMARVDANVKHLLRETRVDKLTGKIKGGLGSGTAAGNQPDVPGAKESPPDVRKPSLPGPTSGPLRLGTVRRD